MGTQALPCGLKTLPPPMVVVTGVDANGQRGWPGLHSSPWGIPNTEKTPGASFPNDSMTSEPSYCWFSAWEVAAHPSAIAAAERTTERRMANMDFALQAREAAASIICPDEGIRQVAVSRTRLGGIGAPARNRRNFQIFRIYSYGYQKSLRVGLKSQWTCLVARNSSRPSWPSSRQPPDMRMPPKGPA